jgi:hypothetical protein
MSVIFAFEEAGPATVRLPPTQSICPRDYLDGHDQSSRQHLRAAHAGLAHGFKHAKDELGWADYRLTDAASIERWWELVMCAYLLVSRQALALALTPPDGSTPAPAAAQQHPAWTEDARCYL